MKNHENHAQFTMPPPLNVVVPLEPQWVRIKQVGKSYILTEIPELPAWALPEGIAQHPPEKPFPLKKTSRKQAQEPAPLQEEHHESRTDPRIKAVRDLAAQKGLSESQVVDWMKKHYQKESIQELDKREYASLLHSMEKAG